MIRHQCIRVVPTENYFPINYSEDLHNNSFKLDNYIFEFYEKANQHTKSSILTSKHLIIIDGYIFYNDHLIDANFILDNINNINKMSQKFNGSYNLVVYDICSKKTLLWNDLYASRPLYLQIKNSGVSILPLPQLAKNNYTINDIDKKFVINQLIYSRIRPQNNSIIKDVTKISGGVCCSIQRGKVAQSFVLNNLKFSKHTESYQDSLYNLISSLKQSVRNTHALSSDLTLHLSGGLDSRLMACLFHSEDLLINSVTWGNNENSLEAKLARSVSKTLNIKNKFLFLSKEMFLPRDSGDTFFKSTNLGDLFSHEAWSTALNSHEANNTGHYTSGISFDVMHGSYSDNFDQNSNNNDVLNSFEYNSFDKISFRQSIESKDIYHNLKQDYFCELNEFDAPIQDTVTLFALKARAERVLFPRQIFTRAVKDEVIPTFDTNVLNAMSSFSADCRSNRAILRDAIMELNADASHIPYLSTLLPVSAPLKLWRQANQIEAARQKLYRDLDYFDGSYIDTINYPYYSNYDSWIANDHLWRSYLGDLLSKDSILAEHFVDGDWLSEQLLFHGKSHNKFQYIMVLGSLELALRSVLNMG